MISVVDYDRAATLSELLHELLIAQLDHVIVLSLFGHGPHRFGHRHTQTASPSARRKIVGVEGRQR